MAGHVMIPCPSCPRDLQIRPEHVGRKVFCKFCASVFRVPTHVLIPCPKCRQQGLVRTEHIGRKIRCKSCEHAFRARAKDTLTRTQADLEVKRLQRDLDQRTGELNEIKRQLNEARGEVVSLDERARLLTDERDAVQGTQEWSIVDEEPVGQVSNGTEPDLPLADLSHPAGAEPLTRVERRGDAGGGDADLDLTKTRLIPDNADELQDLREERDRLREELDAMRESAERTVIARGMHETLERDLEIARADNVRLLAEREEIGRLADGLMKLLQERDATLVELARERDESRSAFDLAEAARLALADELEALRKAHAEPQVLSGS